MAYVYAVSRSYNAARSACRNAARVSGVGHRRSLASVHRQGFIYGDDSSPMNHQRKEGMSGNYRSTMHDFSSINGAISSSDEIPTSSSTESLQIRFLEMPEFSEEDDGG
uniref:Uncharacterized protein n=1 Tax=Pseudo-nitzschia australis TaxID=44445 RepID=A0A7S4AAS9_9STRA|mmetsp:Transcript_9592/g.20769  ORF Transcript_9592/g.20769 Transcript_9592/m.20769 type:complete len:109 (-) Transcript_9592:395-721(-)|eukprot:CAMPEP_0168193812 /NCGR_PEP_ID=MMETSP0139_2-20121125/18816_1 /TAXON_ID=44445 /ORGANISM="Pseudo-nitzschia australis, Strain 10249 10 AB" /LENGTH=108 /DNA_ID=CAMNT_0008117213 /DNA_START=24 /DNA_END=350 /DNA_ORIENTATION=+